MAHSAHRSPNLYEILDLQNQRHSSLTQQDVKNAYRRALLTHHPDKTNHDSKTSPTIDQVALAYKVLSDPVLREEYDRELLLVAEGDEASSKLTIFHTGLETVDLDDLDFDEATATWTKACRCADINGFVITEAELEAYADDGELIIGCRGCSLWLRVLYSIDN